MSYDRQNFPRKYQLLQQLHLLGKQHFFSPAIMTDAEKLICASGFFLISAVNKNKPKNRKIWQKPLFVERPLCGGEKLLKDLSYEEKGLFKNFSRMSVTDFNILLSMIKPKIEKWDTNFRRSISARERLAITLRFLASGDSYTSLTYVFRVSKQAISKIIPEVCEAIISALKDHVKVRK